MLDEYNHVTRSNDNRDPLARMIISRPQPQGADLQAEMETNPPIYSSLCHAGRQLTC